MHTCCDLPDRAFDQIKGLGGRPPFLNCWSSKHHATAGFNNQGEQRESAAADVPFVSEPNGCLAFAPPCGLGAGVSCSTGVCLWSVAIRAKPGNRKARSHANAPLRHETFSTSGFVNASASARPTVRVNALRNNGMTFP